MAGWDDIFVDDWDDDQADDASDDHAVAPSSRGVAALAAGQALERRSWPERSSQARQSGVEGSEMDQRRLQVIYRDDPAEEDRQCGGWCNTSREDRCWKTPLHISGCIWWNCFCGVPPMEARHLDPDPVTTDRE